MVCSIAIGFALAAARKIRGVLIYMCYSSAKIEYCPNPELRHCALKQRNLPVTWVLTDSRCGCDRIGVRIKGE